MTIYLIQNKATSNVKIGYTAGEPEERLKQLQTACCGDLLLVAAYKGTVKEEKKLQEKLALIKVRNEWFKPECIEYCKRYFSSDKSIKIKAKEALKLDSETEALIKRVKKVERDLKDAEYKIKQLNEEVAYWRKTSAFILDTNDSFKNFSQEDLEFIILRK